MALLRKYFIHSSPVCSKWRTLESEKLILETRPKVVYYSGTMTDQNLEQIAGQQNHYVAHVAEINKNNDVIATEDIYNENGLLIVPKNTKISHGIADRILQHKLLKPFDEQIQLKNTISNSGLKQDSIASLKKYPDLQQVYLSHVFRQNIDAILENYSFPPVLVQKLTVMRECLPLEYEKSFFVALLSALIASEAEMQEDLVRSAYIAGLTHDIGLLHISPELLLKQQAFTTDEWRVMQSHVVVSFMILKNFKEINPLVSQAVFEHHERCDGSGYPVGKADNELGLLGQIVGMADSLLAIRSGKFAEQGRNLRDAMPYLHMNAHTHFLSIYNAMCSLLKKSDLQPSRANPFASMQALITHLADNGGKLQQAVLLLEQVAALVPIDVTAPNKLTKVLQPVAMMIESSGLVKVELFSWLEAMRENDDSVILDELLSMELMQIELCWQIKNVCKTINEYSDAKHCASPEETRTSLLGLSERIRQHLCA